MKKYIFSIVLCVISVLNTSAGNLSEDIIDKLADAIYKVEGGAKTKHPYGILSIKTKDPRKVCKNTIRNNFARWEKAGRPNSYLEFLASRYAPIGSGNDPKNLNKNWLGNLKKISGLDF